MTMKIIIAPDSFKGSMDARTAAAAIADGCRKVLAEDTRILEMPVADGGEGTADCMTAALGGEQIRVQVHNALGEPIPSSYTRLPDGTALMDTASAAGLTQIPQAKRDVLHSSTYGIGELVHHAIKHGAHRILLGLGGSATNDAGAGCLTALGMKIYDADGALLAPVPAQLGQAASIDLSDIPEAVRRTPILLLSDVDNPLIGKHGATYTFGPQKGIAADSLQEADQVISHFFQLLEDATGREIRDIPGAGAAGGLGAGLMTICPTEIRPGIDEILDLLNFDEELPDADLVITGEGCIDDQSTHGKVAAGIAARCKRKGIPCLGLAGCLGDGWEAMLEIGLTEVECLSNDSMTSEYSISHAEELAVSATVRALGRMADRASQFHE